MSDLLNAWCILLFERRFVCCIMSFERLVECVLYYVIWAMSFVLYSVIWAMSCVLYSVFWAMSCVLYSVIWVWASVHCAIIILIPFVIVVVFNFNKWNHVDPKKSVPACNRFLLLYSHCWAAAKYNDGIIPVQSPHWILYSLSI